MPKLVCHLAIFAAQHLCIAHYSFLGHFSAIFSSYLWKTSFSVVESCSFGFVRSQTSPRDTIADIILHAIRHLTSK